MSELPATVFVLYGATGDLAKRMVLPAFFDLYARGLLPQRWKLVGNGRGDVAHEDFRGHVHDVLTEFGTDPDRRAVGGLRAGSAVRRWRVPQGGRRRAAGPDRPDPGRARRRRPADPLPGGAAERLRPDHRGAEGARAGQGHEGGLREAVRHLAGQLPRARHPRPHGVRRGAGLPDRPLPGQGGDPERPHAAVRQHDDLRGLESRVHRGGADRRPGDPRHRRSGGVLRRHRRGAGHAGHPPVPGRGRGGDGAAALVPGPRTCRRRGSR